MLPAVINSTPMITFELTGSFNNKKASRMVMTMLSLSMGRCATHRPFATP